MKRFVTFLLCTFVLLLITPIVILAQDSGCDPVEATKPLSDYVGTFAAYCGTCVVVAAFVISSILQGGKIILVGWQKYLIAFIVSALIGIAAFLLQLGIFATTIGPALIYILGGFLMAAGLFKLPIVEGLLSLFKLTSQKSQK